MTRTLPELATAAKALARELREWEATLIEVQHTALAAIKRADIYCLESAVPELQAAAKWEGRPLEEVRACPKLRARSAERQLDIEPTLSITPVNTPFRNKMRPTRTK